LAKRESSQAEAEKQKAKAKAAPKSCFPEEQSVVNFFMLPVCI